MKLGGLTTIVAFCASCGRFAFDDVPVTVSDGGDALDGSGGDAAMPLARVLYIKPTAPQAGALFGHSVSLSRDGTTLAVAAALENAERGAAYIFRRNASTWVEEARLAPAIADDIDQFGWSLALSDDGNTLVVGARREDGGLAGSPGNNGSMSAGAAYVFTRAGSAWSERAYLKPLVIGAGDSFGERVAISGDGGTIAVGAPHEDSAATTINGNANDETAMSAGAVYIFTGSGASWTQQAYVKATNAGAGDEYGYRLAISTDGNTLLVGAYREDSAQTGVGAVPADNAAVNAGAVYVYTRASTVWSAGPVIKASNTGVGDNFGYDIAISDDSMTTAITAEGESGPADATLYAGAVYRYAMAPWTQTAIVRAMAPQASEQLGYCVALSGDGGVLAAGTIYGSVAGSDVGALYLFDGSGERILHAPNPDAGDQFGWTCALAESGSVVAVGAPYEDGDTGGIDGPANNGLADSGAVYVFE